MKVLLMTAALIAPTLSLAAGTSVDNSRQGIVEITISGGLGSNAEKLFKSLTQISEQPDDAMGGHYGTAKQGEAIDCTVENDNFVQNSYVCTIKVTTAGDSLEPWQ